MTPAQLELLRGLTREDLLAVVSSLAAWSSDRAVIRAVMDVIAARSNRLSKAWIAATEAEAAACDAWRRRPESRRLHRAYVDAQHAAARARTASTRAHNEFMRVADLPVPLPAPKAAAPSQHPETEA